MLNNLVTIFGPTATGKTKLAAKLALKYNGEIISADSRQVYIGMDIGTGKDYKDYIVSGTKVNCHLVDITHPNHEFNLFEFKLLFSTCFYDITARKKIPFLVGGTGLYLSSVLQNYDLKKVDSSSEKKAKLEDLTLEELQNQLLALNPKVHVKRDLLSKSRLIKAILVEEAQEGLKNFPAVQPLVMGVKLSREEIKSRITERLRTRLEEGMIEEVKYLLESGISFERLQSFGLEYKFISLYLKGDLSYDEMFQKLNTAIHQFAKRQMTWFRKMEREGVKINWLNGANYEEASQLIEEYLSSK